MLKTLRVNAYWNLRVLLTPRCWLQNYEYSRDWDAQLIACMAFFKFEEVDAFSVSINDIVVWVCNHPYASFSQYKDVCTNINCGRPSRKTILMAMSKLRKDLPDYREQES